MTTALFDLLFERPAVTITGVKLALQTSFRAAQMSIEKLASDKTLVEITGKGRNRIYLAPEIIRVIEKDEEGP